MNHKSPAFDPQRTAPETFRARELTAALTVNDLPKSLTWYTAVLGFTIDKKHEREGRLVSVSLKAGDVRLLIAQDDGAKGRDRVKGVGLSLQLTTVQSVDGLAAGIRQRGGTLHSEPADMPWGPRMFRVKDPDGFLLTIASAPPG